MPSRLCVAINSQIHAHPDACALVGDDVQLSYAEMAAEITALQSALNGRRIGLLMDNSPAWAVVDLAIWCAGRTCVPMPPFFSPGQLRHVLTDAAIDLVVTDQPERLRGLAVIDAVSEVSVAGRCLRVMSLSTGVVGPPLVDIAKITYTSGTTGQPKGVCLSHAAIETMVESLVSATDTTQRDRALAVLPLSTLLENIASLYVPLSIGASAVLPTAASLGMLVSGGVDIPKLTAALHRYAPTAVILIPQLLQGLVMAVESGLTLPSSLRWMAVGGAKVANRLLQRAQALGLPVYQGYGLSEACSVVALNTPTDQRPGSVGRPLSHAQVHIADDGEILVAGALFSGYLPDRHTSREFVQPGPQVWPTGDLGYLDADGYLYVTGRKKDVFITSFGRNVSPEWVESELTAHHGIAQAMLFGEARPFNVAVVVPRAGVGAEEIRDIIDRVNDGLPAYAQVGAYVPAGAAFSVANGQLSPTGKLRRQQILQHYASMIDAIYAEVA